MLDASASGISGTLEGEGLKVLAQIEHRIIMVSYLQDYPVLRVVPDCHVLHCVAGRRGPRAACGHGVAARRGRRNAQRSPHLERITDSHAAHSLTPLDSVSVLSP